MNKNEKKQVLVCGTQYGQVYLRAIDELQDFEVSALLARGSERSIRLSEQRAISLYKNVDQIDEHVDLACVAIGGDAGTDVAASLLKRGVPVLLEHPVSIDKVSQLLHLANKHETFCHVNSHFPEIKPINSFIELCKKLNSRSKPRVINAACNSRTLYSMLDILQRSLGDINLEHFTSSPMGTHDLYKNCTFSVNETPCAMVYQRWLGRIDDSKDSPLGHEITVTYPEGVLRLAGTFGPCQWFPLVAGGLPIHAPIVSDSADDNGTVTSMDIIQWRIAANKVAINNLHQSYINRDLSDSYQSCDWLEHLCRLWSHLYTRLGVVSIEATQEMVSSPYINIDAIRKG